jgi:hypothetical protein
MIPRLQLSLGPAYFCKIGLEPCLISRPPGRVRLEPRFGGFVVSPPRFSLCLCRFVVRSAGRLAR